MTATFALVNQDHANNGLGNIGQADTSVYPLAASSYSDFHDVTSGNNGYYSAGPNYDNVTEPRRSNYGEPHPLVEKIAFYNRCQKTSIGSGLIK